MPWAGGNYTKGNSATGGWTGDASLGIGIEAGRHDTQDNDFATGIDSCLAKNGSNSCTGDLNLGGFKPVNVAVGTAAAPAYCAGGDVNTGMYSGGADTIAWATNGVQRMQLNSTGQLTVSDGAAGTPAVAFTSDPDTGMFRPTTNSLAFSTAGSERVRIDSSGRIGVGTTAPAFPLDVQGIADSSSKLASTRFSNDNTPVTLSLSKSRGTSVGSNVIVSDGDGVGQVNFEAANGTGYNVLATILAAVDGIPGASSDMPGRLVFRTAPDGTATTQERMRINNAGNVGIGETNPAYRLHIGTDSAAKPTTNTWTIVSDERIKTNVAPYAKGLAEILQVQPVTYDYNGKGGIPAGPGGVSILAQQLQPVFPECVGSYMGKLNEDDEQLTEILNYNGHAMTFALINAVKELAAKVKTLEEQLS